MDTPSHAPITPSTFRAKNNQDVFMKLVDVATELRKQMSAFEIKCLNQFDNVTSRLNALELALKGNATHQNDKYPKVLKASPAFNSMDVFKEVMANCEEDDFKSRLTKELYNIGGSSAQAHVSNIMKRCFENEMLKQFTLKGRAQEKSNFSVTLLYQSLVGE